MALGHGGVLLEALGVLLFGDFCGRRLGQGVEGKLHVGHVVTEVFFFQSFQLFVLFGGASAPFFGDDVGEGGILHPADTSALPFVRQFLAHLNAADALVDPIVRIPQAFIVLHGLFDGEFRVLHLVYAVGGDLCHPLFEGLGLGRRDGLDDAEELFRVGHVGEAHLAVGGT